MTLFRRLPYNIVSIPCLLALREKSISVPYIEHESRKKGREEDRPSYRISPLHHQAIELEELAYDRLSL